MELSNDILFASKRYRYQFLDRLRLDCIYFLGEGKGNKRFLYMGNVKDHIEAMKTLWYSFSMKEKPEFLTKEQILEFEEKMKKK